MNRISTPNTRCRGSLLMLLIVASVRVFAGVPDLHIDNHASNAHSMNFGLVAEHGYDVNLDGGTDDHFHCHNCCAHAPMAVSSAPLTAMTKAPIATSIDSIQVTSAPVFAHFRPPRA